MLKTLDPNDYTLIVGGAIMSGFADGTFITVERNNDTFTVARGIGNVTRVKSSDKTGRITITLQRTSDSNDILTGFMAADELTNSGVVPVLVKYGNQIVATAARAWVVKPPADEASNDITNRVWILETDELLQTLFGVESN